MNSLTVTLYDLFCVTSSLKYSAFYCKNIYIRNADITAELLSGSAVVQITWVTGIRSRYSAKLKVTQGGGRFLASRCVIYILNKPA